jgi:hypothetical protein
MSAFADDDAARYINPIAFETVDLVQQDVRIDHDSVADKIHGLRPEYSTRHKVNAELALVVNHCMSGIVAAGKTGHDVHISGKDIDDLPLAFVTPLRA